MNKFIIGHGECLEMDGRGVEHFANRTRLVTAVCPIAPWSLIAIIAESQEMVAAAAAAPCYRTYRVQHPSAA